MAASRLVHDHAVVAAGNEQAGGGRVQNLLKMLFGRRGRRRGELRDQPAQRGYELRVNRRDLFDLHR
jgi:hypothetical protein